MLSRGKPNQTGRSSGRVHGRQGRLMKPPKGEPWVWLTRELLTSDAWKAMTGATRKFIDFLMIEQMNHSGQANGSLKATRTQLADYGISRKSISGAIEQAEALRLVRVKRYGMRVANTYTLTWLPTADGASATNCWKQYRKQKSASQREPSLPPKGNPDCAVAPRETANFSGSRREPPSIFPAPARIAS